MLPDIKKKPATADNISKKRFSNYTSSISIKNSYDTLPKF
jgi:hypothetical protein